MRVERGQRGVGQRAVRGVADRTQHSERNAVRGGDARHRAAFEIDRRGAGLLALPALILWTLCTIASAPSSRCGVAPPSMHERIGSAV